ncbi:hypothetical protein BDN70DRAFT_888653 [Pholiota conissans]|uniref:GAR domain-containing protein n=1 Tax=Pholiota conissans TaxID=109636 RepID=A0A9P6CSB7_9AGAR|nr:hypothetical protein BDN70DRAFT_888653 [Pholiota conissans]
MAEPVTLPNVGAQDFVITSCVELEKGHERAARASNNLSSGEEQALESHEVVELQTFSERKAWIEEKIKFLEALPPIEVFVGLDALRSSSGEVPGLPTRLELQQWMTEHDAIEKETEIFDTGELTKLRQLTKAATQRNLSPEDTDVIELTLTTIYALDKLLHLLRDRSENLDMMNIRLLWEENRQAGWKEQRQIIEDLRSFAASRACWNPAIYESVAIVEDSNSSGLTRRGSIASQASAASDNIINLPAFSRSTRFKLAELLSRDAAQFSGRVTSLRHGKVAAAGKALDRLIDHSRKPVPDELLDEQDRLEEKCINEMENVSKFTMSLVMQWRKADDIYIETKKDSVAAANLLEEIEIAKLHHPTSRQNTTFLSRADTIFKRLAIRGDPSSPSSPFPRPEHFLFPEQRFANENLARFLSADIAAANKLAQTINLAAKEYKNAYEAVRRVETLLQTGSEIFEKLSTTMQKLKDGVPSEDGDGRPPDLTSERCLDPTSHSVFIAFLPSLLEDTEQTIGSANQHLREIPSALIALDSFSVDPAFKEKEVAIAKQLTSLRDEAIILCKTVSDQLVQLRDCRRISTGIDAKLLLIRSAKIQMAELMDRDRWRQQFSGIGAPPTPESPTTDLRPSLSTSEEFEQRLLQITDSIKADISIPLDTLSLSQESSLLPYLLEKVAVLKRSSEAAHQLLSLLIAIRGQASAMNSVRDNYHEVITHIEDRKIRIKGLIEGVLDRKAQGSSENSDVTDSDLLGVKSLELDSLKREVAAFVDGLSSKVSFVARHSAPYTAILKSQTPSSDFSIHSPDETTAAPFDLISLDSTVRADSNSYALRANSSFELLVQLKAHYEIAVVAKSTDSALVNLCVDIDKLFLSLDQQTASLPNVPRKDGTTISLLEGIIDSLRMMQSDHTQIVACISPIRELLRPVDENSKALGMTVWEDLYKPRSEALVDAQTRLNKWTEQATIFLAAVEQVIDVERQYQEELQAAEERRIQEEEERLAAEEAARIRMELERAEEEERKRLAEKELADELEHEAERRRLLEIATEKQRAEQEAAEAEERRLQELEKQAELARIKAKAEWLAQEEAERTRIDQERIAALEKLRIAEEQLEEERRIHAERELAAMDLANRQRLELEELVKKQLEVEALAQENAYQAEMERAGKHKAEKEAKEHEEEIVRQYSELQQLAEDRARRAENDSAEKERSQKETREYAELLAEQHAQALKLAEDNGRQIERERAEKQRLEEEAKRLARELEERRIAREQTLQAESTNSPHSVDQRIQDTSSGLGLQATMVDTAHSLLEDKENSQQEISGKEDDDVFGVLKSPVASSSSTQQDVIDLQTRVLTLRKRLRSICIAEILLPPSASANLPTEDQFEGMHDAFLSVSTDIKELPTNVKNRNINLELKTLRAETEECEISLKKIQKLVELSIVIRLCDAALSDLLEHVDSYPMVPLILSSTHKSDSTALPEDQLSARLAFTKGLVEDMVLKFAVVANDNRAMAENSRIQQTWDELHEMACDRIKGKKSRPNSVISRASSGRESNVSALPTSTHSRGSKKTSSYTHLSASSVSGPQASKGKMLAPPPPNKTRRVISNINDTPSRSTSRFSSASTSRSVSGPMNMPTTRTSEVAPRSMSRASIASTTRSVSGPLNSSLYGSTFASRQRTASLSGNNPLPTHPARRPSLTPSRFRLNSETTRGISPSISETSSFSHSHSSVGPRSSINSSTWARAPRDSLSSILPRSVASQKKSTPPMRKKYIADPKSKLDVAVGDVVNQLEVGINIEGITESWRDQSGKYWIGNQDPKLCFCRILRSQTVMVRVGGGWTELSRFIKDHFADSFRIAPGPDSPPRPGGQAEKWISSATLLEGRESLSPPRPPRTPEPTPQFLPSFALVTPSGQSPKSLQSSPLSPRSSPLTPLQFMRRAGPDQSTSQNISLLRPVTPAKTPNRGRTSVINASAHISVWRP